MNREILFRGKRKDNREWVEGDTYLRDPDLERVYIGGYEYYTNEEGPQREEYCFEVDTSTVCQYTGLTDKNSKKIFEGDIINDIDYGTMKCIYIHGSFVWYKEDGFKIECMRYVPVIEVIGNIFDNPDLMDT